MSTRRAQQQPQLPLPPAAYEKEKPTRSRCVTILLCMWKVFTCIFSHVTLVALVVAYCILGAFTFEHLEADHEKTVKRRISSIRINVTESIWRMTNDRPVLHQNNWTDAAVSHLQFFEKEILTQMKKHGWDGIEDEEQIQWTFFGALFYSIIVITTIGYGHIAPKTPMGKITTIFYAILGIPLMLLCLSNIGDIMASSFRFLYWRVCCYVCTREPKKPNSRRNRTRGGTIRQGRSSTRSQPPPNMRRSVRTSQRSADSGFDPYYEPGLAHAYSEMDCRFPVGPNYFEEDDRGGLSQQRFGPGGNNRFKGRNTIERDRNLNRLYPDDNYPQLPGVNKRPPPPNQARGGSMSRDVPVQRNSQNSRTSEGHYPVSYKNIQQKSPAMRAQSLDRRMMRRDPAIIDLQEESPCKTPVLCNKYALDEVDEPVIPPKTPNIRSQSMPRQSRYGDRLAPPPSPPERPPYYNEDNEMEMQTVRKGRRRDPRPVPSPSPRIMSPMGFAVHRQARHLQNVMDDSSLYDDDWENRSGEVPPSSIVRPVPIWLCVFLVVSYIIAGAFMFSRWENWSFLDSAYFCFITLTTIGFGDFVPAQGVKDDSEISIGICSLYLLFGIALLAMSFNLVQEEVISNVKSVARRLGILKEEEIDEQ